MTDRTSGRSRPRDDGGAGRKPTAGSGRAGRGGSRPGPRTARGADDPADPGRLDVAELSIVPSVPGVHPLAAVGVAAALTAVGVIVDLLRIGTLGTVFTVCYLTGCVLGVAWVRREGLFWPMVVPPLLMAAAVPVVVLVAGSPPPGAGVAQRLLQIGAPLINGFPMMAWTTGLALALGVFRLITQRLGGPERLRP